MKDRGYLCGCYEIFRSLLEQSRERGNLGPGALSLLLFVRLYIDSTDFVTRSVSLPRRAAISHANGPARLLLRVCINKARLWLFLRARRATGQRAVVHRRKTRISLLYAHIHRPGLFFTFGKYAAAARESSRMYNVRSYMDFGIVEGSLFTVRIARRASREITNMKCMSGFDGSRVFAEVIELERTNAKLLQIRLGSHRNDLGLKCYRFNSYSMTISLGHHLIIGLSNMTINILIITRITFLLKIFRTYVQMSALKPTAKLAENVSKKLEK